MEREEGKKGEGNREEGEREGGREGDAVCHTCTISQLSRMCGTGLVVHSQLGP